VPDLVCFAEHGGNVIGFAVALPDLNVALKHNPSGRLYGIPKILWYARKIHRCRILLLGTLREYRMSGIDALMYHWIWTKGAVLGQGCENAEVIYHVAGRISARDSDEFMRANRDGTANVLEAAGSAWSGRFVLVSSLAAGGPTTPGQPIDESRPPSPVTPYGQ